MSFAVLNIDALEPQNGTCGMHTGPKDAQNNHAIVRPTDNVCKSAVKVCKDLFFFGVHSHTICYYTYCNGSVYCYSRIAIDFRTIATQK